MIDKQTNAAVPDVLLYSENMENKEIDGNMLCTRDRETNAIVPVIQSYDENMEGKEIRGNRLFTRDKETNAFIPVVNIEGLPYYDQFYGIEWDTTVANSACTRVGNMDLHRSLPVQSAMRRYLRNDDGSVNYYLHPTDSTKKANGEDAVLDGSDGQVMTVIPAHYEKFELVDFPKVRRLTSVYPLPGFTYVKECSIGAYHGAVDRRDPAKPKLASVVNLTPEFRGGGNTAAEIAHDNDGGTSLGKASTGISLTNFRVYARNRNSGDTRWNCYVYEPHRVLFWTYTTEYANFNCQLPYNAEPTADGYKQGGLGNGVTDLTSANITAMTGGTYSCIPCGITNTLGNRTGVVAYDMPAEYNAAKTTYVPSYRGVENPFGHLWMWTDGCKALIQSDADGGKSEFYVCENPASFNDSNTNDYEMRGYLARSSGWIKEIIGGEKGDIMASAIGGSSVTYFCDQFYTSIPSSGEAQRGVLFGGVAHAGASAGFGFASAYHAASHANTTIGSRLCFIPE